MRHLRVRRLGTDDQQEELAQVGHGGGLSDSIHRRDCQEPSGAAFDEASKK